MFSQWDAINGLQPRAEIELVVGSQGAEQAVGPKNITTHLS